MQFFEVIKFWFEELTPELWFAKNLKLDAEIKSRFLDVHRQASTGELFKWRSTPEGRLAEIIVLDQFSRNIFRDDLRAFSQDPLALVLAQEAVRVGADQQLHGPKKSFLYMPYMHSESLIIHDEAVRLFSAKGLEFNLEYELKHKQIIERFGRYPHRNQILGRTSTPAEIEFLKKAGSSF